MSFLEKIDPKSLPQHVGIIMDGNGRWAAERNMPRIHGHRSAVNAVRASVEAAAEIGFNVLTLFAFSTENWRRPRKEINHFLPNRALGNGLPLQFGLHFVERPFELF